MHYCSVCKLAAQKTTVCTRMEIVVFHMGNCALALVAHLVCAFISNSYLCILWFGRGTKLIRSVIVTLPNIGK